MQSREADLVRLCLISTSAKSTQNMTENLSFNLKTKLSCQERLVKVTNGYDGRVQAAVPHVSMSAIATSVHQVGNTVSSLLHAGLLMPASAVITDTNKSSLCTEENSRALQWPFQSVRARQSPGMCALAF